MMNLFRKKQDIANRTLDSLEDIISIVKNQVGRIIALKRAGLYEASDKETIDILKNAYTDNQGYSELIKKLEEGGAGIPSNTVEEWVKKNYYTFQFGGISGVISKYVNPETLRNIGIETYRWVVNDHEKNDKSNYRLDHFSESRKNIIKSFGLQKEDVIELDKYAFRNMIRFGNDLYYMNYSDVDTLEEVLKRSNVKMFRSYCELSIDETAEICSKYIKDILKGKRFCHMYFSEKADREHDIRNAFGMLIEFENQLGLTEKEELELVRRYKSTEYCKIQFLEKWFPDEVNDWRQREEKRKEMERINAISYIEKMKKKEQEANEWKQFQYYYRNDRENIKKFESFNSEIFVDYDRKCFIDALENGNFRFAYEIALERNYRELPLLEKLKD